MTSPTGVVSSALLGQRVELPNDQVKQGGADNAQGAQKKGLLDNLIQSAKDAGIQSRAFTSPSDARIAASNNYLNTLGDTSEVRDLKQANAKLDSQNANLKSGVKEGISVLFSSLSVLSGGPWAVLSQPLFKTAINAVSSAVKGFGKDPDARVKNAGTAFIASLAADAKNTIDALKKVAQQPGKYFLSQSHAPKTWGNAGAIIGGLIGAAAFGPIGAGAGFLLGKAVGAGLGRLAAKAAAHYQARGLDGSAAEDKKNFGLSWKTALLQGVSGGRRKLTDAEAEGLKVQIRSKVKSIVGENGDAGLKQEAKAALAVLNSDKATGDELNAAKGKLQELQTAQEELVTLTQLLRDNGRSEDLISDDPKDQSNGVPVFQAVRTAKIEAQNTLGEIKALAKAEAEAVKANQDDGAAKRLGDAANQDAANVDQVEGDQQEGDVEIQVDTGNSDEKKADAS